MCECEGDDQQETTSIICHNPNNASTGQGKLNLRIHARLLLNIIFWGPYINGKDF